jgi:glycosyltransferase involved in cell wall biosynthesis
VQIIEDWMNLHQNINTQLIKCPNRLLVGPARNLGVQYLSSEYLWMLDDDDSLYDDQTLDKVIKTLESEPKDIYACGFRSLKNNHTAIPEKTMNATEFALWAAGVWSKIIKTNLYVQQPDYLPEDSWLGCILADNAKTIGTMSFCCYVWDNRQQNNGAITRSWDYL